MAANNIIGTRTERAVQEGLHLIPCAESISWVNNHIEYAELMYGLNRLQEEG